MTNFIEIKQLQVELDKAKESRRNGMEGRARVCARRAAGHAIRAYFRINGISYDPGSSAIHLFQQMDASSASSENTRKSLHYLLMRVDADYNLPPEVDLIDEVQTLVQLLNLSSFLKPED